MFRKSFLNIKKCISVPQKNVFNPFKMLVALSSNKKKQIHTKLNGAKLFHCISVINLVLMLSTFPSHLTLGKVK